ncbi:DUF3422 family protein [Roseovarius rhodophyticola]|uniref:DUF3422 domain-containing protein n=1 Tax=Roseovarius rhodophyticola TaxID=3080827 RepID=A0ABZ2TMB0_9RHOB|nr:DUF3422 domain-containing protein [Roseovarius sp. W115]MDV2929195.1 DUF3422 domain-containing protein [Roseovarius sp. W115]
MPPIQDHPLRYLLANELHARPFPTVQAPATAAFLALKHLDSAAARDRGADLEHLIALLDRYGAPHPQPDASHYSGDLGRYHLKWESHTEFVTYTAFREGVSDRPFDPSDFDVFPTDWLENAPGNRVTSALIRIDTERDDAVFREAVSEHFVSESVAVARVLDDTAKVAGDFRIDTAGHLRFLVNAASQTGPRRIGRIVQRLCEIETYKTMSMLGLARVRELNPNLGALDQGLTQLIGNMPGGSVRAEDTLDNLLAISAELEGMVARSSYRFGASAAYEQIVKQRIEVLREERFEGRQTFGEFMMRRYDPAMRTVRSTKKRLDAMADRAMRAGELLRTRVDVERSAQNQDVLESMNRRADLQLRLQRTVEGLSVVAISYYAVSLAGYVLYPLAEPTGLSKDMLTAIVALPMLLFVWWMVRRIRQKLE